MEDQGEGTSNMVHGFQGYHEEQLQLRQDQEQGHQQYISSSRGGVGFEGLMYPPHQIDPSLLSASHDHGGLFSSLSHLPPLPQPPQPPIAPPVYASGLQFHYDGGGAGPSSNPLGLASLYMASTEGLLRGGMPSSSPFAGLHAEFGRMTAQEIMDAKALAASKSHSEAERRRRERINAHLAKLRSLLPNTTKTDKASLLAEVIQHVKELKRQTSEIAEESPLPTESDELTVDTTSDEDGRFMVRASLCCEDRSDLLQDLIRALKALRLRTLKAEITTLGGRVKNVLVITGDDESECSQRRESVASIQDALKAVMDRPADDSSSTGGGTTKRQRTSNLSSLLQHRSV